MYPSALHVQPDEADVSPEPIQVVGQSRMPCTIAVVSDGSALTHRGLASGAESVQPVLRGLPPDSEYRDRAYRTGTPRRCVVLSDREREALHEIQAGLLVEDPGFAQSFDIETRSLDTEARRPSRGSPDWTRRFYTILLVLSSTYGVILLLAGSPASALALAAMAALSWEARHRRDATSHQRP